MVSACRPFSAFSYCAHVNVISVREIGGVRVIVCMQIKVLGDQTKRSKSLGEGQWE